MAYELLTMCPNNMDGTSRYRGAFVWPKLRELGNFNIKKAHGNIDASDIVLIDGLMLQRPMMPQQVQLASLAKEYKKPIIADYDDNLLCVPPDNPTHQFYSQESYKQNVINSSRMADVITASTDHLSEVLRKYNPNVVTVPNAIDLDFVQPGSPEIPRNPIVMWRGSSTHMKDLMHHQDAILEAYKKFPNYSFAFMGYRPWFLEERMDPSRYRVLDFDNSYGNYMHNLIKFRSAIHIVPLYDHEFNRSKSNLSHLEGTVAGSMTLAPDWEEWRGTGGALYKNKQEFREKLFNLMDTPLESLSKMAQDNFTWIRENRSLNAITKIRLEVMRKYMGYKG